VSSRSDVEDITSETFARALRYRDTYDDHKGEPIAWLLGIARNCVYDAMVRPREQPTVEMRDVAADVQDEVVAKLTFTAALNTLSTSDRELLALRYGAGLSPREIGRLLEQRRNAVDVALSRARARLAAALDQAERIDTGRVRRRAADLADGAL
jgi:RNA polymerase sigma-70 factor (ECF subfamily)